MLCPDCVNKEIAEIDQARTDSHYGRSSGWFVDGVDIHYEGPPKICDHCGAEIESAYGDPEEEE